MMGGVEDNENADSFYCFGLTSSKNCIYFMLCKIMNQDIFYAKGKEGRGGGLHLIEGQTVGHDVFFPVRAKLKDFYFS